MKKLFFKKKRVNAIHPPTGQNRIAILKGNKLKFADGHNCKISDTKIMTAF